MGMSTHIAFLRDKDDEHFAKCQALQACLKAGVEVPKELERYFENGFDDLDYPLEIKVNTDKYEWSDEYRKGYVIDLADIPEGVKRIRFYNSY